MSGIGKTSSVARQEFTPSRVNKDFNFSRIGAKIHIKEKSGDERPGPSQNQKRGVGKKENRRHVGS